MDIYNSKINFDFKTNQKIIRLISRIDEFKGKWKSIEKKENVYLKELRQIATVESIGSSTRIEGAKLSDEEISTLLKNLKITEFKSRDEEEVFGYYELLEIITDNYDSIKLNENYIKQLHEILLKYSSKDKRHRGKYKSLPNKVVAKYPNGKERAIFNPTEPHLVSSEMNNLLKWVNERFSDVDLHPLIVIALFVYEFLSIHPFQDGNGRLSRLLTTLLLLKNGYNFVLYVSLERIIEKKKKEYYNCLMKAQKVRNTKKEIISEWTLFFLSNLTELIEILEKKYDPLKSKGGYLSERQEKIKKYIQKHQPVKLGDIASSFKSVSINTIKKDLQYLKQEKYISSAGKLKGTVYFVED